MSRRRNGTYYHGTREEHLAKIRAKGLSYPFLASEPSQAECWGRNYSTDPQRRDVRILEVEIDDESRVVPDFNLMDADDRHTALGVEPGEYYDVRDDLLGGEEDLIEARRRFGSSSVYDPECGGEASIYLGTVPPESIREVDGSGRPVADGIMKNPPRRRFHVEVVDYGSNRFEIEAHVGRRVIGRLAVVRYINSLAVGREPWFSVLGVDVDDDWRRRGVATAMYRLAAKESCRRGAPLRSPGFERNVNAGALWESLVRSGEARVAKKAPWHLDTGKIDYEMPCSESNPPRRRFVVRSQKQGLDLIRHPAITKNFAKALRWRPRNKIAVLVPCAGTKPFPKAPSHRDGYLAALAGKKADLWVVSEPLGVVPYEWSRRYPNDAYDFPPRFLRGQAWDELVARVAEWSEKVAPKYARVFVALPGHHERLLRAALELHNPGNLRDSTHSQCLSSGACPSGHGRATSTKYRRYLSEVVKNPPWSPEELDRLQRELEETGHPPGLIRQIIRGELRPPQPGPKGLRPAGRPYEGGGARESAGPWLTANPSRDERLRDRRRRRETGGM